MALFGRKSDIKIGIALGGGGFRGLAHIGVIAALEEHGIMPDFICGTSVGSLVGAAWATGMTAAEMKEFGFTIKTHDIAPRLPLFYSTAKKIENTAARGIGRDLDFKDLKIPFACVAVDAQRWKQIVFEKEGNVVKAVTASCSVPVVFRPVEIDGTFYTDGGVHNNIPTSVAKSHHCDFIIAVDVNGTREYGASSVKRGSMLSALLRSNVAKNSVEGMEDADYVINADASAHRVLSVNDHQALFEIGYNATISAIPAIKEALEKLKPRDAQLKEEYREAKREIKKNIKEYRAARKI